MPDEDDVSLDIAPPVPVELEEPVAAAGPEEPAELGELVAPELVAAPVLVDEPLGAPIAEDGLLGDPAAG